MAVAGPAKPRAPRTSDAARAAKRLADVEVQLAAATTQLRVLSEGMSRVISDTEEGRKILSRLNDAWLAGRALTWGKVAILGAISTYPTWSPTFWKLASSIMGGSHGG